MPPTLRFGTIRQTQFIPNAKPAEVYRALMNPRIHTAFTGSRATGSGRVGGRFTAWDGYITAKNLKLKSGRKIVQEWTTTEFPDKYPPSKLDLTLKAKRGGTQISMVHSMLPASQTRRYKLGGISAYWYWYPMREYFSEQHKRRTTS
jgi:uncharacterized protein YndB with AHSA1/START domain